MVAACYQPLRFAGDAGKTADARLGDAAGPDAAPMPNCSKVLGLCVEDFGSAAAIMLGGLVDTDTSPMCSTGAGVTVSGNGSAFDEYCVVIGPAVELSGAVTFTGSHPVAVLTSAPFAITSMMDASTYGPDNTGPGVMPVISADPACTIGSACPSGGGAGGGFGTAGGSGGCPLGQAATAGTAVISLTGLRAGCAGGPGATSSADGSNHIANQGQQGGGILVLSTQQIDVAAPVLANGAGGGGGVALNQSGGCGGGTGGMIVLETPNLRFDGSGEVCALGGGGGGGADSDSDGSAGANAMNCVAGGGGSGAKGIGGTGGNAGAVGASGGAGGSGSVAGEGTGGAGGGGNGIILLGNGATETDAEVAPSPQPEETFFP